MSKTKIALLIILLLIIVGITILIGSLLIWISGGETVSYQETVLEIDLPSSVEELPSSDPLTRLIQPGRISIWEIGNALSAAAEDDKIKAIYIKVPFLAMSWAQAEEIRGQLVKFKQTGKMVHLFLDLDMASEKEIFLASAANEIYMNPTATIVLDGFIAETIFMKGTMEKLGVIPEFLQFKEYKSAETYSRNKMTPEIRSMYTEILADLQEHFLLTVATDRDLHLDILKNYLDKGLISSEEAVGLGLIDQTGYSSLISDKLKSSYMIPTERDFISLSRYLRSEKPSGKEQTAKKVAVVGASGAIITGRSQAFSGIMGSSSLTEILSGIRKDESIDGLILRVDSPGGSAVASDMIWQEVVNIERSGKPVIVSMSGVAGSGGYYISMGARKIVCHPTTITGSIGVIFGKFNISGLLEKLGMNVEQIKSAPNSDFLSLYSSLSEEQRDLIEEMMESTYRDFVAKAAESRGSTYEDFEPKAHGRIYSGNQALEQGLVDELGGLSAAARLMKGELGLAEKDKITLEIFPRPKSIWESLSSEDLFGLAVRLGRPPLAGVMEQLRLLEGPIQWFLMPDIEIK